MSDSQGSQSPLEVMRHSTAHLLAAAVCEMFPGTRYAIGPPIEDGFYYDFDLEHRLSEDDLPRIEERMRQIAARRPAYVREVVVREDALRRFSELGQTFKVEILSEGEASQESEVSLYWTGDFLDLCRGPHVEDAGSLTHFRLTRVAGAYWRGDERNPMLQRIYGTAWSTADELEDHFARLERARERDHKKLGRELGLFFIDEAVGKGLPMWLPKGATLRRILETYIYAKEQAAGYVHVYTPHIASTELYRLSGHLQSYGDAMYSPFGVEDEHYVLRPMNCPHHIRIYQHDPHSYRDLPVRMAEMATVYRFEKSGELSGLIRVRGMTMNDAHIFCTHDQIRAEFMGATRLILEAYRDLGITEFKFRLSRRDDDPKYIGEREMWDDAEAAIREALIELGHPFEEAPGEAAFYGPKLDVQIRDAMGREFTASTTQLDFLLPGRFGLEYTREDGTIGVPAMIHRAPLGTMERLVAFLIEFYAGAFPLWLAPVQVSLIPVADRHLEYAEQVAVQLREVGVRVEVDRRNERMGNKIRQAQLQKIPYMGIIGDREIEASAVSLRRRDGEDQGSVEIGDLAQRLKDSVRQRSLF